MSGAAGFLPGRTRERNSGGTAAAAAGREAWQITMATEIELDNISCGYSGHSGTHVVLDHFSMRIKRGEIWCILGRNGAGKTTLFKTILGTLPALGGSIRIAGRDAEEMSRREMARVIAYVPQYHTPPFAFTVREIVVMGRNAYIGTFGAPGPEDRQIADRVIRDLGIEHLADQDYTRISGGERQMVLIARALAQQSAVLMMDEPAANLDYGNQVRMLQQIRRLAARGISVVFTSHNPEHAFLSHAKVAAILGRDRVVQGQAEDIITEELIAEIYGIRAHILRDPQAAGTAAGAAILPLTPEPDEQVGADGEDR